MSGLPASFGETAQQKHRSGDQRSLEVDQVSAPPYAVRDGTVVPDQRLSIEVERRELVAIREPLHALKQVPQDDDLPTTGN